MGERWVGGKAPLLILRSAFALSLPRLSKLWESAQFLGDIIRWGRGKIESKTPILTLGQMKRATKIAPQAPDEVRWSEMLHAL
jgi:hypothetical protein